MMKYKHEENIANISVRSAYEELKHKIEMSNLSLQDKELSLEIARLKLDTENVKSRAIDTKSRYENTSNNVKQAGILSDIFSTGSKLLRNII
jgi:hypothetical protein